MDQYDDRNLQDLWKFSKLVEFPPFVKSANVSADRQVHYSMFADVVEKKFPCDDPANTWLSQLYFLKSSSSYPKYRRDSIKKKLDKFAEFWSITEQVDKLRDEFAKCAEEKIADDDYALITEYNGETIKKFPIKDAKSASVAAEYLYENRDCYPYEWRKQASKNILDKAEKFKAKISPELERYLIKAAGLCITANETLGSAIVERIYALKEQKDAKKSEDTRLNLAKIAQAIIHNPSMDVELMQKIAQLLDDIDTKYSLKRKYHKGLRTPEESVFGLTIKSAVLNKLACVKLITGSIYDLEDLKKLKKENFDLVLQDSNILYKNAELDLEMASQILPTLPMDDASLLDKVCNSAGIRTINDDPIMEL
jgi:hypothetical protein